MSRSLPRTPLALAALATMITSFVSIGAHAQLGMYTLPKGNFVWNWGRGVGRNSEAGARPGFEDFSIRGSEQGFQCELTGKAGLSGRMSQSDIRALEEELRARIDFIYAASTYMNELDQQNLIDWARLACEKAEPTPSTEEEKAEHEARAKEKMQREIEKRRARARATD